MKLGKAAILILACLLFLALLFPITLGVNLLFPNEHSIPNVLTWWLSLVLLGLAFRSVERKFPKVFAEEVLRGGPKLTLMRAAVVVVFVLFWAGTLIWIFGSLQLGLWQTYIVGAISLCFLLFVVSWLERRWSPRT